MSSAAASFYVTGGTLQHNAPSYVERQADQELYEGLTRGEFCYVLTSRQMGKSSLMGRTAARLRFQGLAVAILDLAAMGQHLTVEQWYDGLLRHLGWQLDLEEELEAFWLAHLRLSPLQRWLAAFQEVVLADRGQGAGFNGQEDERSSRSGTDPSPLTPTPARLVIFIDEIDTVRSLPFATDEFFAALRHCYNRRTEDPAFTRLTFCLLGVATPSELIRDPRATPFNIGTRIDVTDFTATEAAALAKALGCPEPRRTALLQRVLHWTGGHPYLTQRLCQAVAEDLVSEPNAKYPDPGAGPALRAPSPNPKSAVDRRCEALFLSASARASDDNLLFVRSWLLRSQANTTGLLDLYAQVWSGRRVPFDATNPLIDALRLSGLVRIADDVLQVRNRIYQRVFDREWLAAHAAPHPLFAHNLPTPFTRFIGRKPEIAALKQLLGCHRLVTLTGMRGSGKTRLALEVVTELRDAFPHGVWLVELASMADPTLVPQTLATALGVRDAPSEPLQQTLLEWLKPKQLLLLLDHCEHLPAGVGPLAAALVRECAGVQLLATSRDGLNVAGERTFAVPPLAAPDAGQPPPTLARLRQYEAVQLFLDRATAAVPCFALTPQNTPAVAQICARLDGIPLAIELAAARLKALPLETLSERLGDMFGLLTGGENRLVTVLVVSVARSPEATQDLPPEEAAALMNRLLGVMVDAILKWGGHVDRFLADGLLAVFGTPPAHEDDATRAIRAAIEIQEVARSLPLEVATGIDTGEIYLGEASPRAARIRHGSESGPVAPRGPAPPEGTPSPPGWVMEVSVAGPVVSRASWLQGQAEPGQILVGEGTHRQTRGAFEFGSLGLEMKGRARPVAAYAIARALTRPEKTRGIEGLRAELIGRDEELAKLKAVVAAAHPASPGTRGRGQMVSLIGEAGVGKSRLVAELKQWLGVRCSVFGARREDTQNRTPNTENRTPLWLEGRCLEFSMAAGYSVFEDLFRDYFALTRLAPGLASTLQELAARGALSLDRVEEMRPLLSHLLSSPLDTGWDERLKNTAPEQIQYQTFLAVRDFFVALSGDGPVVLVLEDLHWADSLSLDLVSFLMESLPRAAVLLLCVYRPEREHKCAHLATIAERKCPECFTEIRLRELTPEQSGQMVESLLPVTAATRGGYPAGGANLSVPVKALILEKSRGNPFFLEEIVRSLIDAGVVTREGEGWRARKGIQAVPVPESIQSLILSRFDRLRPHLQRVLQCAAVIGRVFRSRLLERVVASGGWSVIGEGQSSPLASVLWELEDHGLVYEERVVPETEYSFKHALMQQTIYGSILTRHRARFHQQVAEVIETLYQEELPEHYEQLAYHYERSAAAEKALEYLLKAGQKAKRAYLNEDAIACFQRALERLDKETVVGSRQAVVEGQQQPDDYRLPTTDYRLLRLEALRGLGEIYQGIGKHSEAEEQFRRAITLGQAMRLAPRELARLYFWLGDTLVWQRRAEEMIGPAETVLTLLGEHAESVEAALMNEIAGIGNRWRGNRKKGLEYIRRNARFLQRLPYSEELRSAYDSILMMYMHEEDNVEEATRWAQVLEDKARQHHDLRALGGVLQIRSGLLQVRGDLRGAIAPLQQALEPYGKIGGVRQQYLCYMRLREDFLLLGDLPEAEAYANKQWEAAEAIGDQREIGVALVAVGKVFLCQGRWDQATDAFQKASQVSRQDGRLLAWAAHAAGRACLAQGKRREARKQLQEAAVLDDKPDLLNFIDVLSGLEEAYDDPDACRAFCRRFRAKHPEAGEWPFAHWYLEPAEPEDVLRISNGVLPAAPCEIRNTKYAILASDWVWHDPFGDCSLTVRNGLEIRAANGRDLCHPNRSAPRLLRSISGDFAIQAVCRSAAEAGARSAGPDPGRLGGEAGSGGGRAPAPAIGGLLLWKNKEHYLRLDWGARGPHQVSVGGCLPGKQIGARLWSGEKDVIIGRGRLVTERIILRLERLGGTVRALCSADGQDWFTVGQVEFPAQEPLEVGLHAIGTIDRMIYPGAYPEGTAIRFEAFELWA